MAVDGITLQAVTECFGFNSTSEPPPWDNHTNVTTSASNDGNTEVSVDISDELADDISFAIECVTMPILVIFGITGNILSLVVLSHRRLRRSSTTVLLIGLALSDCMYLITTMVRKSTCIISTVDKLLSYKYFVLSFSSVYYINTCFSRVSTLLVAVMSLERLIAVVFPLKVKLLCTKTRMTAAVVAVVAFTFGFLALLPMQYEITYRNDTPFLKTNTFYRDNKEFVDIYNLYITVSVLRWLPKVIVVMCNGIIIFKLWKRRIPSGNSENASAVANYSSTQRRVTIMLLTVAVVFVLTLLPGDAFWITTIVVEEFKLYGKYKNLFSVFSNVTLTFEIINSSVNFVIYIVLNSTFANVYLILFCPCHSAARRLAMEGTSSRFSVRSRSSKYTPDLQDSVSNISGGLTSCNTSVSRNTLQTA